MSAPTDRRNVLDRLETVVACTSTDMSESFAAAMVYAIVLGWEDDDDPDQVAGRKLHPADEHIETPAESVAIVDSNLRAKGSVGLSFDRAPSNNQTTLVGRVLEVLAARPFTYRHETDLQVAISERLDDAEIGHRREARLGARERIDLLTDDGVGIEVKVAGSWTSVVRQLLRYADHDQVKALVLVTTQASHGQVPAELGEISVAVHSLIGQGL